MKYISPISGKILKINLSEKRFETFSLPISYYENYLGGKGAALKLFYELVSPKIKPFSAENPIIIFTGPFTATGAPNSGRFSALTLSPLTGIIVHSSCGGPFGIALKKAGYEGIIILGKAERLTLIEIYNDNIVFKNAEYLKGLSTTESQRKISPNYGSLVIGPSGENLVLFSNVASGERFFGRGGIGAVFGSKNLKALSIKDKSFSIKVFDEEMFKKLKKKANSMLLKNEFTGHYYKNFGTNTNILLSNKGRILPVRNFSYGSSKKAYLISGELIKEKYETKFSGCKPCTIQCGHKAKFNDEVVHVPEYETNALFGANLEIFDPVFTAEANKLCGELGLDTISTAVVISYLMEAQEKGFINSGLKFGEKKGVLSFIEKIAKKEELGEDASKGTKFLSQKYGGEEFSINVKGLELPAYDPRGSFGQGLSYAVSNRGGCHLSATIFPLEVYFGFLNPETVYGKAKFVKFFEDLYSAINSLQTCIFTAFAYILEAPIVKITPKLILSFAMRHFPSIALNLIDVSMYSKLYSSITGIELSQKKFLKSGERITVLERYINTFFGASKEIDTLPKRFLDEARLDDEKKKTVPLDKLLEDYYNERGYDKNGIPKKTTLKNLSIEERWER